MKSSIKMSILPLFICLSLNGKALAAQSCDEVNSYAMVTQVEAHFGADRLRDDYGIEVIRDAATGEIVFMAEGGPIIDQDTPYKAHINMWPAFLDHRLCIEGGNIGRNCEPQQWRVLWKVNSGESIGLKDEWLIRFNSVINYEMVTQIEAHFGADYLIDDYGIEVIRDAATGEIVLMTIMVPLGMIR